MQDNLRKIGPTVKRFEVFVLPRRVPPGGLELSSYNLLSWGKFLGGKKRDL